VVAGHNERDLPITESMAQFIDPRNACAQTGRKV